MIMNRGSVPDTLWPSSPRLILMLMAVVCPYLLMYYPRLLSGNMGRGYCSLIFSLVYQLAVNCIDVVRPPLSLQAGFFSPVDLVQQLISKI